MNGLPDRAAALRGALIAIAGLAGIAALAGLAACSSPGADDGGSTSHTVTQSPQEVASYWTDDRMAATEPAHMPVEP